ncbi:MAG: hypothetical protein GX596_11320 [Propionibacterium sp.]|nr:hypothetical protein [Propionibacterium sp.]
MTAPRPSVLLVSDPTYPARGRRYGDEDIFLASRLRETFDVATCHPLDAVALMGGFDVVLVRNSGPAIHHWREYQAFREHALATGARVFNDLTGKGDMLGKQYLLDLFDAGYPVIPTVDDPGALGRLPASSRYVVKPKLGADSLGLRVLDEAAIRELGEADVLIQPEVAIRYEVSFFFVGHTFQYALHAPDHGRRWELVPYEPTEDDLRFARSFVEWNDITHGIQRIDGCRTADGDLLLVELEDLNPYLSLDALDEAPRERFLADLTTALLALAREGRPA